MKLVHYSKPRTFSPEDEFIALVTDEDAEFEAAARVDGFEPVSEHFLRDNEGWRLTEDDFLGWPTNRRMS